MKKIFAIIGILLFGLCFFFFSEGNKSVLALSYLDGVNYVIYSVEGDYLFEKQDACVGDEYIDADMNCFVIVEINEQTKTGKAKFVKKYVLPQVVQKKDVSINASSGTYRGKIGLYLTHNDESYITGDGYDSIYGAGGVHDVAKLLCTSLKAKNIDVSLDETLHIPHDTNAYTRSNSTAKKLINSGVDAIFDIHRDATSRAYYVTKVNGEDFCMVRMVVGKANPNYEQNKAFALFLMSVAKTYCPQLFVDIYMAKGHYNQALSNYAMLFEFGSHLVEKSLVLKTVPYLADVLSIALYGELVVQNEDVDDGNQNVDSNQEQEENNEKQSEDNNLQEENNEQNLNIDEKDAINLNDGNNAVAKNNQNNTANTVNNQNDTSFVNVNQNVASRTNGYLSVVLIVLTVLSIIIVARNRTKKGKH